MKTINKRVENCGLKYCAFCNSTEIICCFDDCVIMVEMERLREFLDVFGLASHDCFIHEVEGKLCRVIYDDYYTVLGIQHILDDDICFLKKKKKENQKKIEDENQLKELER